MKSDYLVTKSNYFIMNSSYDLTIEEQRIILTLASTVSPNDEDFKTYKFKISDFAKMSGTNNKNIYSDVQKLTKGLMKKVFEIQEGKTLIQSAWLSGAKYEEGSGVVELTFNSLLKPYMLRLNELFTRYRLANVLGMKSKYSPRIYEILKANEFKAQKQIEISVEDLRRLLKAEDIYKRHYDFKAKVLLPAQKDLETVSDIVFDFDEIKEGREVKSIVFKIKPNMINVSELNKIELIKPIKDDELQVKKDAIERKLGPVREIVGEGFTDKELILIFDAANGEIEMIQAVYIYAKTKKVDNMVGYMLAILKNGFNVPIESIPKKKKDFDEREYDFDALERKLLGWD